MASGITTALSHELMDHVLRNAAYTSPTAVYLALFSTAPTVAGGGTELTGFGYAREAITFGAPSARKAENTGVITFTASGGAWSAIVGHALFDLVSAGQMQFFEDSVSGPTLGDGESYQFAVGAIDVDMD